MCSKKIIVKIGIVQGMIIMFLSIMIYVRPNMELDVDLSQWQSRYISFMDNVWAVSEGEIQEQNVDLIYGPYVNATRGGIALGFIIIVRKINDYKYMQIQEKWHM